MQQTKSLQRHENKQIGGKWIAWGVLCCLLLLCLIPKGSAEEAQPTLRVGMSNAQGTEMVPPQDAYEALLKASLAEIAKYTNWRYEYVYASEAELLDMLADGEVDMLAGAYDREDLYGKVIYPAYHSGFAYAHLVASKDNAAVQRNNFRSLQGTRIAVLSGGRETNRLLGYLALNSIQSTIIYVDSVEKSRELLEEGQVDMAMLDSTHAEGYRIVTSFVVEPFYIVAAAGKQDLADQLSEAYGLIYASDPSYDQTLYERFFVLETEDAIRITEADRAFIQSMDPLRVAVYDHFAPFQYFDGNGEPQGIAIDILNEIKAYTGIPVEILRADSIPEAIAMVNRREADAILGIALDGSVAGSNDYVETTSYLEADQIVLVNRQVDYPSPDMTLALMPGMELHIDEYAGDILYADTFYGAARLVNNGEADYTYGSTFFYEYGEGKIELHNTRTIMLPGRTDKLAIGLIRPVKPELLSILNKAIRSISDNTRDEIIARNTALSGQQHTLETFLYAYPTLVIAILAAIVLVMVLIGVLRARHTRQLFRTKYTDEVTGALNLQGFRRTGARLLQSGRRYAITYESIRNLQFINDHYGYQAGDDILRRVARMMDKDINSETEAFCRVTGGVFVALRTYTDREAFLRRLEGFHDTLGTVAPENEPSNPIRIASGIYFAHEDDPAMDIFGMMDRASAAHQQIAGSAEQDSIIYEESFYNRILRNQEIESRMEAALENDEFIVFLQPKYALDTMRPAAAEALVRWRSVGGLIPPDEFIPLFERNGFVTQLDTYMFEQTCKLIRRWLDHRMPVVPISVNISRVLLRQHGFVQRYIDIKRKYAIPNHLLELEVTESALLEDEALLYTIVSQLHEAGFRCSIDDFGKGYSSLTMLKNLPVDTLKLDAQFFKKGVDDMRDDTVVRSVINIARSLGMMTVAEGIESREQVAFLKDIGCDMVQGYVFSRPLDASSFETYLHRKLIGGEDPYVQ